MEIQFDVITTGDDTTLIQEYSPIYLNPNDLKVSNKARGFINLASIPSAFCLSSKEMSRICGEDEDEWDIELKAQNAIENEDYGIIKELLDEYFPKEIGSSIDLLTGFLYYTAYEVQADIEKKVKFIDFIFDYYNIDPNNKKAPVLPLVLCLICGDMDDVSQFSTDVSKRIKNEKCFSDDLIYIAGYLIKKGAKIDIDDSPLAEHLSTLAIRCFIENISKFPVTSLERITDAFEDINKRYFKVHSEKFTLLEYIYYLHDSLEASELCTTCEEILLSKGAKKPRERKSIEQEKLLAFLAAVDANDIKKIKELKEEGVNPNYLYKNIDRPIFSMIYQNENLSSECLEALLTAGVDPNQPVDKVSQGSLLEYFILEEKVDHIKVLVKNGADINKRFYSDRYNSLIDEICCISPFEYAINSGLYAIAEIFGDAGAESIYNRIDSEAITTLEHVRNLIDEEKDEQLLSELESLEKTLQRKGVKEF